jgi:hypothetical protein
VAARVNVPTGRDAKQISQRLIEGSSDDEDRATEQKIAAVNERWKYGSLEALICGFAVETGDGRTATERADGRQERHKTARRWKSSEGKV